MIFKEKIAEVDGVTDVTWLDDAVSVEVPLETLASGSKALVEGSSELKQGSSDLYDGIITLSDGTDQLKDGTQEFYEQTEGMETKIEDELDDMIDSISGGDAETTSYVSEKNGTIDSVQFVDFESIITYCINESSMDFFVSMNQSHSRNSMLN